MNSRTVHGMLECSATRYPDKTAVIHGKTSATYGEINLASNRLASFLVSAGLKKSDRVLVVMQNSVESVISYYGILKAGGICVEVPEKSTHDEAAHYIQDSGSRILIASGNAAERLAGLDVPIVVSTGKGPGSIEWGQIESMPGAPPDRRVDPTDTAAIVYTSGSTGKPKGVVISHENIYSNTESIIFYLGLTADDRVMDVLPFYYVYGKTLLNTHFFKGGSIVINNRFAFPNSVVKEMIEKEVTGFAGVPSTFAFLLNRSIFPNTKIPSLRYVTQAGGAMASTMTRRLLDILGEVSLFIMYGATEASARLTYLPPEDLKKDKIGSIGIPIPDVKISIRDDHGEELAPGRVGNICAMGPNIMQGYWNDNIETARVLKPWGLVTGDLGHIDNDGFIYLTGRKKEMLKIGGERVSPREIEDAILESGSIHEVAVVGKPDEILTEVPVAHIVPIDPKNFVLEELREFLSKRLSPRKHPREWNILKNLPKNPSGKTNKEALKE